MIPKTKQGIQAQIADLEREISFLKGINTSCSECANFSGIGCRLAGDHLPPPEVLAVGCPEWVWNEVPF